MAAQSLNRERLNTIFPEDYLNLIKVPVKLFHPYRLLIMQTLVLHGNAEFRQLRPNIPEITDGNLASHLSVLEGLDLIKCHKEIVDRKLRTSYEVTEKGRKAFEQLMDSLRRMIEHGPNN